MSEAAAKAPIGRREARRLDRQEAIIAIAARSFLDHGYAATTMSAIAATIGGSKGTLWSHFASKEELFTAVIDRMTTAYRAKMSALLDPCGDPVATLRRFCQALLDKVTSADAIALHRLVLAESGRFPEIGEIFHTRAPQRTQRLLADFLERMMARGQLRPAEPLTAARMLIALCLAGSHQRVLIGLIEAPTGEQLDADIDSALSVFLHGYAPRE